jgi:uracil-DNA glycosylase
MHAVEATDFESFRRTARELIGKGIEPRDVIWSDTRNEQLSLLRSEPPIPPSSVRDGSGPHIPRQYFELARLVSHHRSSDRWPRLYSVLWRITHGERELLKIQIDDDVLALNHMRQEIARDVHHMHAFVRFRRVERDGHEWFVAWFRPDHRVLRLAAKFFVERFAAMRWAILTPDESAYWDGNDLRYEAGVADASRIEDSLETLWSEYYRSTFNPARLNVELMRQELPTRFWAGLPELRQLSGVLAEAPARIDQMKRQQARSATTTVPDSRDLTVLRQAAARCTSCPLHCTATQTVFGEGSALAPIMLIGEQPGDVEDELGKPFVGPAGEVLNRAMVEAGVARQAVYMTNAVKHFKFTREGKRRIHQTPRMAEVIACRPWLEAEIEALRPQAIVLLGATAAKSLLGSSIRVDDQPAGPFATRFAPQTVVTIHPSYVLRIKDAEASLAAFHRLVAALRTLAAGEAPSAPSLGA